MLRFTLVHSVEKELALSGLLIEAFWLKAFVLGGQCLVRNITAASFSVVMIFGVSNMNCTKAKHTHTKKTFIYIYIYMKTSSEVHVF